MIGEIMANSYTKLFYHFVWATKNREPFLQPDLEQMVYGCLRQKCEQLGVAVHALNGMPDHVHLACTLPTALSIAKFMETIKGGSAHCANHLPDAPGLLYWQPGYGALSFSRRDLPRIVAYIDNQKMHHQQSSLYRKMEIADSTGRDA